MIMRGLNEMNSIFSALCFSGIVLAIVDKFPNNVAVKSEHYNIYHNNSAFKLRDSKNGSTMCVTKLTVLPNDCYPHALTA